MADYTVRLLYDVPGWAYHHRCKGIQKYAPADFQCDIGPDYGAAFRKTKYDLVMQLCYSHTRTIRRHIEKKQYPMVIVSGINVGGAAAKPWLKQNLNNAEFCILNSEGAYRRCIEKVKEKFPDDPEPLTRLGYISNGVDRERFYPFDDPAKRKVKVISITSKFHKQNKGYHNILIPLSERLGAHGIETDFRVIDSHGSARMNHKQMAEWYNTATIYLVASKTEGTPNPALEAASSGCTLVATRVGNMPELIRDGENGFFCERNIGDIERKIVRAVEHFPRLSAQMQKDIEPWHWKTRAQQYYDLFRRLIDEYRAGKRLTTAVVSA